MLATTARVRCGLWSRQGYGAIDDGLILVNESLWWSSNGARGGVTDMNTDIIRAGAYKRGLLKGLMATTFTALSLLLSFPSGAEKFATWKVL